MRASAYSSYIILFLLIVVISFLGITRLRPTPTEQERPTLSPPSSWHHIYPGQTTLSEVVELLGEADSAVERMGYQVLSYENRKEWGWEQVEIWAQETGASWIVKAVFLDTAYRGDGFQSLADIQSLGQLASQYGRPDEVLWATICGTRYVVWARHGVAAKANAFTGLGWDKISIGEVLFFEPMPPQQFIHVQWPWSTGFDGWLPQSQRPPPEAVA